jgi:predicted XRE-type DNA-binding protein
MKIAQRADAVEASSGNVFADLGLANPQERLAKAELAHRISQILASRRLTQSRAARLLGLDQSKLVRLLDGKFSGFSLERLLRCLNDLGQEVEIRLRPATEVGRRGNTRVVAEVR